MVMGLSGGIQRGCLFDGGNRIMGLIGSDLRPEHAASQIGKTATVCVVVASAKFEAHGERSRPYRISGSHTRMRFYGVIYGDHRSKFGTPETSLRGKRVCVTGQISDYHRKPEIVLTDPSQLTQ